MLKTSTIISRIKPQWFVPTVMLLSLLGVISFQILNFEPLDIPKNSAVISSKLIYLQRDQDSSTKILDESKIVLVEYPKGRETFVSSLVTVIERDRLKRNMDKSGPLILQQTDNKRISIFDPTTAIEIDLMGFGAENVRIFSEILIK